MDDDRYDDNYMMENDFEDDLESEVVTYDDLVARDIAFEDY